ncbi:MAG TPA: ribonuclease III domain-containing protein [Nannocystaceae bacterium]|nr:ribonuclease III domain-containing protein [Nannocystaceae bacterium]
MRDRDAALTGRSVRTQSWIGDAVFELQVRTRVALRGDFPVDRLDAIKAEVVRAESQAALLEAVLPALDDDEAAVVRRARNTTPPNSARGRRAMQSYRAASALEALIARWWLVEGGDARFEALLGPQLDAAITRAVELRASKPKRG